MSSVDVSFTPQPHTQAKGLPGEEIKVSDPLTYEILPPMQAALMTKSVQVFQESGRCCKAVSTQ